jgi:hypothetical protein
MPNGKLEGKKHEQSRIIESLKQAGITVEVGLKKPSANEQYFTRVGTGAK